MSTNLHSIKEAEDRVRASLFSALNSTVILYLALIGVIILGVVFARG